MPTPYIGEIRMYGGVNPPADWHLCDGSMLSISSNYTLFSVIGTAFGGDGISTFQLPDLRSRFFVSQDNVSYFLGQTGGAEQVALTYDNLPSHTHGVNCSATGGSDTPKGNTWGPSTVAKTNLYATSPDAVMSSLGITNAGKGKSHDNMVPFVCVNYIISLTGIYPSDETIAGTPDQTLSEIRLFPFDTVPRGWIACNGQQLPVQSNAALFSLLSNFYGGDGVHNFRVPNLVAAVPMHVGPDFPLGQTGGEASHLLNITEMPAHNHNAQASSSSPSTGSPQNANWASNTGFSPYGGPAAPTMYPLALYPAGNGLAHENRSPFLVLNVCMATQGIYPTRP
jgi:microcystin-dependent protein